MPLQCSALQVGGHVVGRWGASIRTRRDGEMEVKVNGKMDWDKSAETELS